MITNIQAIILAAGKSTRFNIDTTKLAQTICGQAMILFPTKLLQALHIPTAVVVGYQQEIVKNIITAEHADTINFAVQEKQQGTGHALACTKELWNTDNILVMNGDVPFVKVETIKALYEKHVQHHAAISFITSSDADGTAQAYGRVIKAENKISIIEAKDFIGDINKQQCVNAGIYLINKTFLENYIATLDTNNANNEFYITDLVKIASHNNLPVTTLDVPFNTVRGINTFAELAIAEQILRTEIINDWMNKGVRFSFPQHTRVDLNVIIGQCSFIESGVHLRGNSSIGKHCTIKEFSSLENTVIEDNVTIHSHSVIKNSYIKSGTEVGPFAHLRSNVTVGQNSIIGNFVEIKNSTIDKHTKAKHLSYIGDATIGSHVNIGAGTITCNYDGVTKHKTVILDNAFIGSNNSIIAPITIGNNAYTAAGSTITENVPDNALAIARVSQTNKVDYAQKLKTIPTQPKYQENHLNDFSFIGARIIHPDNSADDQ